jgi:RsiW-degrading membrane proteinase PrsW (M82 family)
LRLASRVASAVALAFASMAALGCSTHLAGTNDAELEYAVAEAPSDSAGQPAAPAGGALAAAGVKARLVAAQVPADVDARIAEGTGDARAVRIRVVVDADVAGAVDGLVTWRGGLAVARVDGAYSLAPPNTTGLRPMIETAPDGSIDRWWQGSTADVARAVREARLDPGHAAFVERLPGGGGEARTRVVAMPPIVELGLPGAPIDAIEPREHGKSLGVRLSPEARALLQAEAAHGADATTPAAVPASAERVAFVRGDALLGTGTLADALRDPLVLSFGDDVTAYTRAYHARLLLKSPILPALRRVTAQPMPPRYGLAAACAMLPFALSFAWLFFVRRFDRARPEPMWLVLATFALGCLSVVPAAFGEMALAQATPWLDPSVVTLGGQAWALPLAVPVFAVAVGLVEESSKLLGAWSLARHRREFDEPVDGIIYGCAASLGFAAVENVKYFALGRMSGVVIALRAFMTVPAHMFFGAIWGYAMGTRLVSRRTSVPLFLGIAALAHGAFDAFLSTDGAQLVATLLMLALGVVFFALLRRTLRHGAVPVKPRAWLAPEDGPATEPLPPSMLPRKYFRVGSPAAFYGCAAAMIVCAFALTVLGSAYELLQHRAGVVFVAIATVILALFGLASYGATATIPLDVAIDARGITFAGGSTPWAAIRSVGVEPRGARGRAVVRVETRDRPMLLGPASIDTARAIAEACGRGGG